MTKEMINQLKDFELFVEKMEKFVDEIKNDDTLKKVKLENLDLHTKDDNIYPIPTKLEDYFDLWKIIKKAADDYFLEFDKKKRTIWGLNEFYFDLYWNDIANNAAYFQYMVFWATFNDKKGITYEIGSHIVQNLKEKLKK